jgi:hypothetical protein
MMTDQTYPTGLRQAHHLWWRDIDVAAIFAKIWNTPTATWKTTMSPSALEKAATIGFTTAMGAAQPNR